MRKPAFFAAIFTESVMPTAQAQKQAKVHPNRTKMHLLTHFSAIFGAFDLPETPPFSPQQIIVIHYGHFWVQKGRNSIGLCSIYIHLLALFVNSLFEISEALSVFANFL